MAGLEEQERRATVRLVNYWLSLHRGQGIPAFVDFDPHRNPIPWDQCLLASCGGPDDVVLEHVGNALAAIDREGAGGPSGPTSLGFISEILLALSFAVMSGAPQHHSGNLGLRDGRNLLYRSVLLPFRSLDAARHYVLGAASFKIEPAASDAATVPHEKIVGEPARVGSVADAADPQGKTSDTRHGDP